MNFVANLRSAFNKSRRRNTIVASTAALVIATAAGTATAITLTIDMPRKYESLVEIAFTTSGAVGVHEIPPGKKVIITDLIFSNTSTTASPLVKVYQGSGTCGFSTRDKIPGVVVPPRDTVDINLTTGLYFGPGDICVSSDGLVNVALRGYYFQ